MVAPYNYSINVPNPLAGFLQGVQIGQVQRQQEQERQNQQLQRQQQAAFLQDIQGTIRNPTPEKWQELYAKHPLMVEQISTIRKNVTPAASNLFTRTAIQVLQSDAVGDVEGAAKQAEDAAAAAQASGMTTEAQQLTDMAKAYRGMQGDPTQRRGAIASLLAVYADKEQYDRINKIYGFDMPAPLAEYQARVRKDGKDEADVWWESQGKFMTTDTDLIDIQQFIRDRKLTGKPAPKGVTFTPLNPEGGQTEKPSGTFQGQ